MSGSSSRFFTLYSSASSGYVSHWLSAPQILASVLKQTMFAYGFSTMSGSYENRFRLAGLNIVDVIDTAVTE